MPRARKQFKAFYIIEVNCDTPLKTYVSILIENLLEGLIYLAGENEFLNIRIGKIGISKKNLRKCLGDITLKPYIKPKH